MAPAISPAPVVQITVVAVDDAPTLKIAPRMPATKTPRSRLTIETAL